MRLFTQEFALLKAQRDKEAATAAAETGTSSESLKGLEERANSSAREAAAATKELAALRTARQRESTSSASEIASLQQALAREKARGDEVAATAGAETGALSESLKGLEERANSSAREAAAANKELAALRAAQQRESTSSASEIANLQQALAREKARGDEVARDWATRLEELRSLQETRAKSLVFPLEGITVTGRERSGLLGAPVPVMATGAIPAPGDGGSDRASSSPVASGPPPVAGGASASPAIEPSPTVEDRLTARADTLFRSGDVSGARLLLERAQEAGNAQAIFLLAETFDPNALAAIGAVGIRSDPAAGKGTLSAARWRSASPRRARAWKR